MKTVHKACPCVLRQHGARWEILVFQHPAAGRQIATGTVEADESPESGALRELAEESGLQGATIVAKIAEFDRITGAGPTESGPIEQHVWHLFHVRSTPDDEVNDSWQHSACGSAEEIGLSFEFFWIDVEPDLAGFYPFWNEVFTRVRTYIQTSLQMITTAQIEPA